MAEVQLPCTARKFAEIAAQIALAKTSPNQREPRQIGPSSEGPLFLTFQFLEMCPAGRAHCAWGGHFEACIPCLVEMMFDGPPGGRR